MKKYFLISCLILITSFILFFEKTWAQGLCYEMVSYVKDGRSAPWSPLFNIQIFNGKDGCFPIAKKGDLTGTQYSNGLQFIFDLIIGASIALAVILFTVGAARGILFEVNAIAKEDAKEMMRNAIVGLLVILGSWLVVNTINPDLLRLPTLQGLYSMSAGTGNNSSGGQSSIKVNPGGTIDPLPPNTNAGTGLPNDVIVGS